MATRSSRKLEGELLCAHDRSAGDQPRPRPGASRFLDCGSIADLNVFRNRTAGRLPKPHALMMVFKRSMGARGSGTKVRDWNRTALYERWADPANALLSSPDIDARGAHHGQEARGRPRRAALPHANALATATRIISALHRFAPPGHSRRARSPGSGSVSPGARWRPVRRTTATGRTSSIRCRGPCAGRPPRGARSDPFGRAGRCAGPTHRRACPRVRHRAGRDRQPRDPALGRIEAARRPSHARGHVHAGSMPGPPATPHVGP